MAPAYDLLSTVNHTPQESDTALDLYKIDLHSEHYASYGNYGRDNFMELARRLGIVEKRAARIVDQFNANKTQVIELIEASFLSEEVKFFFMACFTDKLKRIQQIVK